MKKTTLKYKLVADKASGLFRVIALRAVTSARVRKGTKGGLVSGPENLSQAGNCWIAEGSKVTDNSKVMDNARVCGVSRISGNVIVSDDAFACNATLSGEVRVMDRAVVGYGAKITGFIYIRDNAVVEGSGTDIDSGGDIRDEVKIRADTKIRGHVYLRGVIGMTNCTLDSSKVSSIQLNGAYALPEGSVISKSSDVAVFATGALPHAITVAKGATECLVRIGCTSGNVAWFEKMAKRLARQERYTEEQCDAVRSAVYQIIGLIENPPRAKGQRKQRRG